MHSGQPIEIVPRETDLTTISITHSVSFVLDSAETVDDMQLPTYLLVLELACGLLSSALLLVVLLLLADRSLWCLLTFSPCYQTVCVYVCVFACVYMRAYVRVKLSLNA